MKIYFFLATVVVAFLHLQAFHTGDVSNNCVANTCHNVNIDMSWRPKRSSIDKADCANGFCAHAIIDNRGKRSPIRSISTKCVGSFCNHKCNGALCVNDPFSRDDSTGSDKQDGSIVGGNKQTGRDDIYNDGNSDGERAKRSPMNNVQNACIGLSCNNVNVDLSQNRGIRSPKDVDVSCSYRDCSHTIVDQ